MLALQRLCGLSSYAFLYSGQLLLLVLANVQSLSLYTIRRDILRGVDTLDGLEHAQLAEDHRVQVGGVKAVKTLFTVEERGSRTERLRGKRLHECT